MPRSRHTGIRATFDVTEGSAPFRLDRRRPRLVMWLVLMTLCLSATAGVGADTGPRPVFGIVSGAFEDSDASRLAALVHPDGVLVTGSGDRASRYSPSQAVYFFRNLFEGHRTLTFLFIKSQDKASGDHARGMAAWKRRRVDSERVVELQLVIVLARDGDQWRLSELNMIR